VRGESDDDNFPSIRRAHLWGDPPGAKKKKRGGKGGARGKKGKGKEVISPTSFPSPLDRLADGEGE